MTSTTGLSTGSGEPSYQHRFELAEPSDREAQLRARVALAKVCEPMNTFVAALAQEVGVCTTWEAVREGGRRFESMAARVAALDLERELEIAARLKLRIVIPGDPEWPTGVDDLMIPPWCLWVRGSGDPVAICRRSASIVGSRASTGYGQGVASEIGYELAGRGVAVVSGAAFGIDAAAHRGALAAAGPTVAVLAGGADRDYPSAHRDLIAQIASTGLVISENPPGAAPMKQRFLARNRLIAALGQGVLVVEAGRRSGALNTVSHAEAICRPVGAVPGLVTSAASAGVHQLLRDARACVVTDAEEMLELIGAYGADLAPVAAVPERPEDRLEGDARMLYDALPVRKPASVDKLTLSAGLSVPQVLAALGELELSGHARFVDGGWRKA